MPEAKAREGRASGRERVNVVADRMRVVRGKIILQRGEGRGEESRNQSGRGSPEMHCRRTENASFPKPDDFDSVGRTIRPP